MATNKLKIINDPVYGFIRIPYPIIFDIIQHPWFQRLRRIKQMGLSDLVYPGATHTRFHHALGAMHLMQTAIHLLKLKNVEISEEEAKGACLAILLHDIGHGPFSHALEEQFVHLSHEEISLYTMQCLNQEFNQELDLAIKIFTNQYHRTFFHQMVSSQLDMDRLDYLTRDSFYTGVVEGRIGFDRILHMMNVVDDKLVFEEKGIHSIVKFLSSRELMYRQVYLHKTCLSAEKMLVNFVKRIKYLIEQNPNDEKIQFARNFFHPFDTNSHTNFSYLHFHYMNLDDADVWNLIKTASSLDDFALQSLTKGLLYRQLYKSKLQTKSFDSDIIKNIRLNIMKTTGLSEAGSEPLLIKGDEYLSYYDSVNHPIIILKKSGELVELSKFDEFIESNLNNNLFFLCYYHIYSHIK